MVGSGAVAWSVRLRWTLLTVGVLGLIVSLTGLPTLFGVLTGQAAWAYSLDAGLPAFMQWYAVSNWRLDALVAGALAASLILSGRRALLVVGVLVALVGVAFHVTFASGSYWMRQIAVTGNAIPYTVAVALWTLLLGAASVVAIFGAIRMRPEVGPPV